MCEHRRVHIYAQSVCDLAVAFDCHHYVLVPQPGPPSAQATPLELQQTKIDKEKTEI